ncbi:MAG: prepilin-type N-terminal cleavage/methylation domain-containing protein, partial [Candidatus Nanopelagicales bacterium]|nr:prepilin-type N-terminal cleavage/methylation domain-containing protein [Candidatus Nanopelagicales bacterium]
GGGGIADDEAGFSLVEVLIAIPIIAILSVTALYVVTQSRSNAGRQQLMDQTNQLINVAECLETTYSQAAADTPYAVAGTDFTGGATPETNCGWPKIDMAAVPNDQVIDAIVTVGTGAANWRVETSYDWDTDGTADFACIYANNETQAQLVDTVIAGANVGLDANSAPGAASRQTNTLYCGAYSAPA